MKFGRPFACALRIHRPASRAIASALRISAFALALAASWAAGPALADEQRVSRLGLAISAMVTTLNPDAVNDGVADVNRIADQNGVASIDEIRAAPFFQAEGRFFISDRLVAVMGVGKIKKISQLEILPNQATSVLQMASISGVPRHIGMDYYFTPYTRGDFTLRPFVGGGFMDVVEARAKVGYQITEEDTVSGPGFVRARGEGPGFYLEGGTHLMLPSRYSFIINVHYRHVKATDLRYEGPNGEIGGIAVDANGDPIDLDFSGIGLRLAVNMNLWNKF